MSSRLIAPLSGVVVLLNQVPDAVFAGKVLGDGIAIEPTSDVLVAPSAATVSYLHPNHHALSLTTSDGVQILLHIGIDTVNLKGLGFTPLVKTGDSVRVGQELIRFDVDAIALKAKSLVTVMVITEPAGAHLRVLADANVVAGQTELLEISSVAATPAANTISSPEVRSEPLTVHLHSGLHARPSGSIAAKAKTFSSSVFVIKGERRANARSVTSLLDLNVDFHDVITFAASGSDAAKAVGDLRQLVVDIKEEAHVEAPAAPLKKNSNDPLAGISLAKGLAIGQIYHIRSEQFEIDRLSNLNVSEEMAALEKAILAARQELRDLSKQSAIFAAHEEILNDPELLNAAIEGIELGTTSAFAWMDVLSEHASRLARSSNPLLSERAADLRDVRDRVLRKLVPTAKAAATPSYDKMIIVGEHLTPSDTVAFDADKVVGLATTAGGVTSHVAILAQAMGIPAVGGLGKSILDLADGKELVIDGSEGRLREAANASEIEEICKIQNQRLAKREEAMRIGHEPAITEDGHRIDIHANISSVTEARRAVEMGADGVGLLRSEFIFIGREKAPTEDEQYEIYQEIADILDGRPFVIRTLDIGGDKPLPYLKLPVEENPFLGVRGIRVSFMYPEMFREQLRAVLRVRSKGPLHLMFPMVATLEEFRQAKMMVLEEMKKLSISKGPSIGIMMEVPSVAMMADAFAREVDFFSVGTNDLTQYTLAMDRGNSSLAKQTDGLHPSVLKMIEHAVRAAKAHGKWVGVCGGIATDPQAIPILLGLGVDELSSGLMAVSQVKAQVRGLTYSAAQALAQSALEKSTAAEVRALKVNSNTTRAPQGAGLDL